MKTKKKRVLSAVLLVILLTGLAAWIAWGNTALELNRWTIADRKLPAAFDGYRIAQVSDLHNAEMGEKNERLLALLQEAEPDIIVITGDLIDSRRTDTAVALEFAERAAAIAPCYYVTGNHEARIEEYAALKAGLTELGVTMLENSQLLLTRGEDAVALLGIDDPSFQTDYLSGDSEAVAAQALAALEIEHDRYNILLSHRPELLSVYARSGVDLVLSGHAHGGQLRLPFIGGLYAPNQGLFPKYDAGMYTEGSTTMLVSRGIGNSLFPFRVNDRPEVLLIELHRQA